MTTEDAINRCKSLADKYGSAIIDDDEWVGYLNMAQYEVLNRIIPDSMGGVQNVEFDINILEEVKPLVYSFTVTPAGGQMTIAALNSAMQSASGDPACTMFRLLNLADLSNNSNLIRFIKHNNLYAYIGNKFKRFDTNHPGFTVTANAYQFYPNLSGDVRVTALKTPKKLTNTGEALDYSDYVSNQVIFQAVEMASIQLRDQELTQVQRNSGVMLAQ